MRPFLLFVLLLILKVNILPAQNKEEKISEMMQYASDNNLYNGVLLVAENGKIVFNKGFGYADIENKKLIDEYTMFNLCSISKQFTAMCIMMLKEQNKISYEDKLSSYFPELPYPNITIRQLLNHTSGLPDYFELLFHEWNSAKIPNNQDVIDFLIKKSPPVHFSPGEKFEYCNTGYMLLASILEKISGMSYADFLQKNIFNKLGMKNTMVYFPGISKNIPANLALPYTYDFAKAALVSTSDFEPYHRQVTAFDGTYGDGGIHSCSTDMFKWDSALKTETLVKKSTLEEAFTSGKLANGQPIAPIGYGFGWFILNDSIQGKYVYHTGGWPGFRQAFSRNLDKDRTLIVLRNNETSFFSIQKAVDNILDDKPYIMPQPGLGYLLSITARLENAEAVRKKYLELKSKSSAQEDEINLAGYGILGMGRVKEALEIMKINVELFPGSWNAFDSLAEAYLKNGEKENAKINYQKSLELNPNNDGAKKALSEL